MKERLLDLLNGKNITIISHDVYDVDSIMSGILLSNLLKFLNIDNQFVILQKIKEDDTFTMIKELFDISLYVFFDIEDKFRNLFLVDHYETKHLGNVIACIDHHPTTTKIEYPYYYCRHSCSTSYLIYELMQEFGYEIDIEEAKMIIFSMMTDTVAFRSEKTVKSEIIVAKNLAKKYNIDYSFLEKYSLCITDINNMSLDEIVHYGIKEYLFNGKRVKSSYVQVWDLPNRKEIKVWLDTIGNLVEKENLAMWVFIIYDLKYNDTYEYHILKNNEYKYILTLDKILSRGTNIMPRIEKIFENI